MLADVSLVRGDISDLPLAVPYLNSAVVYEVPSLNAGRLVVRAADNSWLSFYSICLIYSEKAVFDHFACLLINWSE
jgi:hypothetical protein